MKDSISLVAIDGEIVEFPVEILNVTRENVRFRIEISGAVVIRELSLGSVLIMRESGKITWVRPRDYRGK